ncbi:hypothetical protein [Paenibacillus silvisoli]|uniref:hypothetical protein n=1 Tax=Paenibacillus silvisoli TaxID=3110539 RepID=UPI00280520AB|nr:hypothetical protein [Paenibacillus silvisoli]
MESEYITVLGDSYLDPIVTLFEQLKYKSTSNEVQTSPHENGYSTSIILLTVIMVESYLARARHFKLQEESCEPDNDKSDTKNNKSVLWFTKNYFKISRDNLEILDELFVVRDVIAHNHIWKSTIDQKGDLKFVHEPSLEGVFGDKKFITVVDRKDRVTKKLRLNVFPTRICKIDAIVLFENAYLILKEIEDISRTYVYISHLHVQYKDEFYLIEDFIRILKEEVDFQS